MLPSNVINIIIFTMVIIIIECQVIDRMYINIDLTYTKYLFYNLKPELKI